MFIFWLSPNKEKKKKIYTVLEFGKLEYHATQYMSIPVLSTLKKKKNYTVLELGKLKYCVNGNRVYQARVPQKIF